MARTTRRTPLLVSEEERSKLEELSRSRTAPLRESERAMILLAYVGGKHLSQIAAEVQVSRDTVYSYSHLPGPVGHAHVRAERRRADAARAHTPEAKAW